MDGPLTVFLDGRVAGTEGAEMRHPADLEPGEERSEEYWCRLAHRPRWALICRAEDGDDMGFCADTLAECQVNRDKWLAWKRDRAEKAVTG